MAKRALLIGCNYLATPSIQLYGCINDTVNMRNTLIDAYGYRDANIFTLRDDDRNRMPTRANILTYLSRLIAISTPSDMLWVHYSGHGTLVRDTNGDETSGNDSCIVPCDYSTAGLIIDDDIQTILKNAKCRMMICLDSCNSGTGCDLQYSINYNNGAFTKIVNNTKRIAATNIVMLSGCRDSQTSADAYDSVAKMGVGAFTQTLLETLRASDHTISLLPLYSNLCANLRSSGFTQIPVLSSTIPSPSFQFVRTNANSSVRIASAITISTATKDFTLTRKQKRGALLKMFY